MALTRVASSPGSNSGTSGTAAMIFGSTPVIGDLMVAGVSVRANNTMTATNGWTSLTQINQSTSARIGIFWKIAVSGDTSSSTSNVCTFTSAQWGSMGDMWNASTGWPASPVASGAESSQAVASTTSYTTPTITPGLTGIEGVVVTFFVSTGITRTWSAEAVSGSNVGTISEVVDAGGATFDDGVISVVTGNYQGSATQSGTAMAGCAAIAIFTPQGSPELLGRPFGQRGTGQMQQLLSQ